MKKVECDSDKEYITNQVCRIKAVSRNVQVVTHSIEVIKPIKSVWVITLNSGTNLIRKHLIRPFLDQNDPHQENLHKPLYAWPLRFDFQLL
jgi:hypothetical protein